MEVSQSISNSIHLLQRINKLFKSSELSDIKLIFSSEEGGPKTEFHLHKLILCSGSEVFRAMFGNEAWRESKTSEVIKPLFVVLQYFSFIFGNKHVIYHF